jgi:hypothetical protein
MATRVTPARYELLLTRSQKLAVVLPFILVLVVPVLFYLAFSNLPPRVGPGREMPEYMAFIPVPIVLAAGAFLFWIIGRLPYRITVTLEQQLVFKSLLTERTVSIADLVSIEPGSLNTQAQISGYVLKHRDGSIKFPGQFTGMYILLGELKQANPALEIRGY